MILKLKQNIAAAISIASLLGGCGAASLVGGAINNANSSADTPPAYIQQEPKVEVKTETLDTEIPFETTTTSDPNLEKGQTRIVSGGSNGIKTTTYRVTYTDGIETERTVINTEITKQPVAKVVANGTYVAPQAAPQPSCQNGSYVNTAGQTVCRPSSNNTGGATAICEDGSYSYSQSRRGTCSHHGGVAQWLWPTPRYTLNPADNWQTPQIKP